MKTETHTHVSRREWMGLVAGPAVAAAAVGAWASTAVAADSRAPAGGDAAALDLGGRVYNIRAFGAKGDGATLDSAALQAAIDACTRDGGGTVLVPAGDFLIGTVELKSNVTLHLSAQGRLLGSKRREDYSAGRGVPPGNGNVVLLYAVKAKNLTIEGPGTIDGQGTAFFTGRGDGTSPVRPAVPDPNAPEPNRDRPHMLIYSECENLRMRDVFLTASAYHGVRILRCVNVNFDGVRIYNRVNINNDGFHFNNCEYVRVSNCEIRCQDDACALFGSNKFVTVTNCTFSTRWSIFRFGGGASQNIAISNCLIYETYGCPIKVGAGRTTQMENVSFSNIVMKNVTGPIGIGFSATGRQRRNEDASAPLPPLGFVRNLTFSNIRATVVEQPLKHDDMPFDVRVNAGEQFSCLTLNGMGEAALENITLSDVHVTYVGGGSAALAAKRDVQEYQAEYFGVWNQEPFGPPAYGMYARNVKALSMQNVRFTFQTPDLRPAVVFDQVRDATIIGLTVQGNPEAESALRVTRSQDVLLTSPRLVGQAKVFLQLEGEGNARITLDGGDVSGAAKPLVAVRGATESAVRVRT